MIEKRAASYLAYSYLCSRVREREREAETTIMLGANKLHSLQPISIDLYTLGALSVPTIGR